MSPPKAESDAAYLEAASRIIFMGGLNRQVVDRKWPGFREVFDDFDPQAVAEMSDDDVERLTEDDRVIKYGAKLKAVRNNAREMRGLAEEHGSFRSWVEDLFQEEGVEGASKELADRFAYISEEGARNWLYSTGHDVGPVSDKVRRKYAPYEES